MVPISFPYACDQLTINASRVRDVERAVVAPPLNLGGEAAQSVVVEADAERGGPVADRVTAGEPVAGEDAALAPKLRGIQHLVGTGIEEHRLGVHPRLVVKCGRSGHRSVERDRDPEDLGEHRIELGQHLQPVVLDQLGLDRDQARHHRGERHDAVALPDAEDGGVDMCRSRLERRQRVCHRAAGVVVGVELDVAADVAADQGNQVMDL